MTEDEITDHDTKQFVKFGKELLEKTERPNVITLQQFEPYIPIFAPDQERMKRDSAYSQSLTKLLVDYRNKLGINIYQPTLVVDQLEKPQRVLLFLDRWFSRIQSDHVPSDSAREKVPSNVNKIGGDTRDALILNASVNDLMAANSTEGQAEVFRNNRAESALMLKIFVENNLSPEKREAFLAKHAVKETEDGSVQSSSPGVEYYLEDDD